MRLSFFTLSFILLFCNNITGQARYRPDIEGDFIPNVYVVTNRTIEKDRKGSLIFSNTVDTINALKFLRVSSHEGLYDASLYNCLGEMIRDPLPYKDWAVWVHGDGQSFLLSMKRAIEIQHLHKVNLLVFSWPTQAPDKGPIGNHKNSRKNAELTVSSLQELLIALQDYRSMPGNMMEENNLSIFFHSLANLVLQQAVEQGALNGISVDLFDNLILNAPAVESENHCLWVEKLNMQDRLFICYNDEDINLEGLRVISNLGTQLGEKPLAPLAKNAIYADFTRSVGSRPNTGATHSYYYALITRISSNIREFYSSLFHGQDIDFTIREKYESTDESNLYKIKF